MEKQREREIYHYEQLDTTQFQAEPQVDSQQTNSPQIKQYKKKDLRFKYLSLKQLKQYEEHTKIQANIVGITNIHKQTNKTDVDILVIESNNKEFRFEVEHKQQKHPNQQTTDDYKPTYVKGYIYVGGNNFIAIKKTPLVPILLLFLILGLLLVALLSNTKPTDIPDIFKIADTQKITKEVPTQHNDKLTETIKIPGYANLKLTADKPNINLENPENNTVYITYEITDEDGNNIVTTDAITEGQMLPVDIYSKLSKGEHTLNFLIKTYDKDTKAQCNGATQLVTVTVE